VVDTKTGAELGSTVSISGQRLRVVGQVENRTYLAGRPVVYVAIADAQRIAFHGRPLASAILVTGVPADLPPGLVRLSNDEVEEDMLRPLEGATSAINLLRILMWVVAAVIIGAIIYLSALERLTDFAVLKAMGGESRTLALGLSAQALIASLLAAVLAALLAQILRPAFPLPITISTGSYLAMVGIAAAVGILASLAALRKVLRVDPALAFS
jgi:putative ABC transport system permease protein